MKKHILSWTFPAGALGLALAAALFGAASPENPMGSEQGQACLGCHQEMNPGLVAQWWGSVHARAQVDCWSCHQAKESDPAGFEHYGLRIAVIVTPNYCAGCHEKEAKEFAASRHAEGARFIGSLDNFLGEIVEGGPAAINGCRQCHGRSEERRGGKEGRSRWSPYH